MWPTAGSWQLPKKLDYTQCGTTQAEQTTIHRMLRSLCVAKLVLMIDFTPRWAGRLPATRLGDLRRDLCPSSSASVAASGWGFISLAGSVGSSWACFSSSRVCSNRRECRMQQFRSAWRAAPPMKAASISAPSRSSSETAVPSLTIFHSCTYCP